MTLFLGLVVGMITNFAFYAWGFRDGLKEGRTNKSFLK
jgi:hypothetical protein